MGLIAQLILGGVVLAALGGAFLSWKSDIRKEGEAKVLEQVREQQAARDRENLRLAQEGEQEARRLLAEAQKRTRAQIAKAASDAVVRKAASDERAKDDREFALWREQRIPAYATERLRVATILGIADAPSHNLSTGTAVQAPAVVPAPSDDERGIARIRGIISRAISPGVASGSASQK